MLQQIRKIGPMGAPGRVRCERGTTFGQRGPPGRHPFRAREAQGKETRKEGARKEEEEKGKKRDDGKRSFSLLKAQATVVSST